MKHIDIRCQFTHKLINKNVFQLKHENSKNNKTDFLTKPLPFVKFQRGICNIFFEIEKIGVFTTDGTVHWKSGHSLVFQSLWIVFFSETIVPNRIYFCIFVEKALCFNCNCKHIFISVWCSEYIYLDWNISIECYRKGNERMNLSLLFICS